MAERVARRDDDPRLPGHVELDRRRRLRSRRDVGERLCSYACWVGWRSGLVLDQVSVRVRVLDPVDPGPAQHPHAPKPSVRTLPNGRTHYGPHEKVYICHSTGSATNPYVLIHVSKNALRAHTRHHDGRDIVLGDSPGPGCPAPRTTAVAPPAPKTLPPPPCVHAKTVAVPGYVLHHTGSKSHPWVKIHPSTHSAHYSKHAADVVVPATTRQVMVAADDCSPRAATTTIAPQATSTTVPVTTTATTAGTTVTVATTTTVLADTSTVTTTVAAAVAATTTRRPRPAGSRRRGARLRRRREASSAPRRG